MGVSECVRFQLLGHLTSKMSTTDNATLDSDRQNRTVLLSHSDTESFNHRHGGDHNLDHRVAQHSSPNSRRVHRYQPHGQTLQATTIRLSW